MKETLTTRLRASIARFQMLHAGDRVGVAVSGGADSVGLLRLLLDLRAEFAIQLSVLHFHHGMRGEDADRDAAFAADLAAVHGLPFDSDRADVSEIARRNKWNLEDAARRLRYQFFQSHAAAGRVDRVAVAHTADDQAETLLAHLLRGTGPTGLASIYPVAGIVVRPLFEIRRNEIREYLNSIGQAWREDQTNLDTRRLRARIRYRLLPLLETEFQPAVVAQLGRLAGLAREDEAFWSALEENCVAALFSQEAANTFSVRIADLLSPLAELSAGRRAAGAANPALALSRRLVRRICKELRGSRGQLTARHVEDVLHLATASLSGAAVTLPGVRVERDFDRLVFSAAPSDKSAGRGSRDKRPKTSFEYSVSLADASAGASVAVPEIGRRFTLKVIDWVPVARETTQCEGVLDFDRLRLPLVLRSWRPGDGYRPQYRKRVRKLKHLLLESRVPLRQRAGWPVLTSSGELVWARGFPVADDFAPREGTRMALKIAEEQL